MRSALISSLSYSTHNVTELFVGTNSYQFFQSSQHLCLLFWSSVDSNKVKSLSAAVEMSPTQYMEQTARALTGKGTGQDNFVYQVKLETTGSLQVSLAKYFCSLKSFILYDWVICKNIIPHHFLYCGHQGHMNTKSPWKAKNTRKDIAWGKGQDSRDL